MERNYIGKEIFEKYKKTKHREVIIETLNLFEIPATAEEILEMFKYLKQKISLSTIYRNLEILTKEGVVTKSNLIDDNKVRYALDRKQNDYYVVCIKCNKMKKVEFPQLQEAEREIGRSTNFKITGHKFEMYGHCPECSEQG